jgi:hypothetical protein
MKILFVGLARAIWLFDLSRFNSQGISYQAALVEIGKRYKFAKIPNSIIDFDERKGLPFKAGTFVNSKGRSLLISFTIYIDGFVAETMSSTDDATEFLVEVTNWLSKEFGFELPPNVRKAWASQIDYESDAPLTDLNPKLAKIISFLDSRVKPPDGKPRKFDVGGLHFWTEDISKPGAPAAVKFERKIDAPFSDNHYFSQTPLQTQDHKDLLVELERLLMP